MDPIKAALNASADLKRQVADTLTQEIHNAIEQVRRSFESGGKLLLMGNGGSAADAQHLAAEFIGRYKLERSPIAAIALTVDSSILTCVGNDYSFDDVFARQVQALAREEDTVLAISTSGNSGNVIRAVEAAKQIGAVTIGFLGKGGGKLKDLVDIPIIVPSTDTARIQEVHITLGHILCETLDREF